MKIVKDDYIMNFKDISKYSDIDSKNKYSIIQYNLINIKDIKKWDKHINIEKYLIESLGLYILVEKHNEYSNISLNFGDPNIYLGYKVFIDREILNEDIDIFVEKIYNIAKINDFYYKECSKLIQFYDNEYWNSITDIIKTHKKSKIIPIYNKKVNYFDGYYGDIIFNKLINIIENIKPDIKKDNLYTLLLDTILDSNILYSDIDVCLLLDLWLRKAMQIDLITDSKFNLQDIFINIIMSYIFSIQEQKGYLEFFNILKELQTYEVSFSIGIEEN